MKPMTRTYTTAAMSSAILLGAATATRQRHQRPHQQPKRSLHVPATQQAAEKHGLNAESRMHLIGTRYSRGGRVQSLRSPSQEVVMRRICSAFILTAALA